MITRSYSKGKMVVIEESMGRTFFLIKSGAVKVTRMSDDGREVILAMLGEGDFFGEMALLDGEGRSANVVTIDDSVLLNSSTYSGKLPADLLKKNSVITISPIFAGNTTPV